MIRPTISCAVLAVLLAFGCDKKEPAPGDEPTRTGEPKPAPKTAKDEPKPVEEPERVSKTGVLDLELATKGNRHSVRNATFEVTFPSRPQVQSQKDKGADGTPLTSGLAIASSGSDEFGFFVMPIPDGVSYDVEKGMTGARDGAMNNIGAKILKEEDTKLGGLSGRKISATAVHGGRTLNIDLYLAWDEPHRQLFGVFTSSPNAKPSTTATDFVGSLKVKAPTVSKNDPDAPVKVTKTGVLDLELAEQAGMFTLRDDQYRVTFPAKPALEKTDSVAPDGTKLPGAVATATIGNDQAFGMILILIPKDVPYNAKKGLKGARDGMVRQIGAKVIEEKAITIAGVPGRRTLASATVDNKKLTFEMQFAYDKKRHAVFGLYTAWPAGVPSATSLAFFSSFGIGKS